MIAFSLKGSGNGKPCLYFKYRLFIMYKDRLAKKINKDVDIIRRR